MGEDRSILALAASPRENGYTDRLLDAFLDGFPPGGFSVTKFYLSRLRISPCNHCGGCLETGVCVQNDDMNIIYKELARVDILVLASPVYFMGVAAQAKIMIDRCQALWVAKYKLGRPIYPDYRPGAFISAAGQLSNRMFECPLRVVRSFYKTVQFKLSASVLEGGLDEKDPSRVSPLLLEKSRNVANSFMRAIEKPGG